MCDILQMLAPTALEAWALKRCSRSMPSIADPSPPMEWWCAKPSHRRCCRHPPAYLLPGVSTINGRRAQHTGASGGMASSPPRCLMAAPLSRKPSVADHSVCRNPTSNVTLSPSAPPTVAVNVCIAGKLVLQSAGGRSSSIVQPTTTGPLPARSAPVGLQPPRTAPLASVRVRFTAIYAGGSGGGGINMLHRRLLWNAPAS